MAYLTCNFTPPGENHDALLSHDEVITLFHEFGHGLHHMLSRVDFPGISGINGVEWDAVELPSQFMENWCYEPQVLARISAHYQTGEVLSSDAFSLFEEQFAEHGLDTVARTGDAFKREILARGGSRDALESFMAFRGRAPNSEALLRYSGLQASAGAA